MLDKIRDYIEEKTGIYTITDRQIILVCTLMIVSVVLILLTIFIDNDKILTTIDNDADKIQSELSEPSGIK